MNKYPVLCCLKLDKQTFLDSRVLGEIGRFVDGSGRLLGQPVVKGFVTAERMLELLRSIR